MPSTIASIMSSASLEPEGVVAWGDPIPSSEPGVYVVALARGLESLEDALEGCPLSDEKLREWLERRPGLRLDGNPLRLQSLPIV